MELLTDEFIKGFPDEPKHMNQLGKFVFYRTYSRWLDEEGRRETFKEAIRRSVEYNMQLSVKQTKENGFIIPVEDIQSEAKMLFENIFNLKQFLSGRTHWVGGADTKVAEKFPLSNFNCAFTEINEWEDMVELFYLLLIGTGVGLACSKEMASNLPMIRRNYKLDHSEYKPVSIEERLEDTKLVIMDNGYAKIYIGDSKEGWIQSLRMFLELITSEKYKEIHNIKISYNSIRPRGERLKTFGGTASGHETLQKMFSGVDRVFKDELDPTIEPMKEVGNKFHVRPIHILDIANLIGNNVVAGGVRRTAEIFLCDEDDYEVIFAKYGVGGIFDEDEHKLLAEKLYALDILPNWWNDEEMLSVKKNLTHRYMSNNSIMYTSKPSQDILNIIFDLIRTNGEPGFVNKEEMLRRRPNAKGLNPCAEIILDSKQTCNLTTVNVMAFVEESNGEHHLNIPNLLNAQALSVRAGMRMTLLNLELNDWEKQHKRDRLLGTSLTGWKDAIDKVEMDIEQQNGLLQMLKEVSFDESLRYSNSLRIPIPLLVTTVKPEGTLSQVAGGVSSGLHVSYAPHYIRRIRINATDPLAEVVKGYNWKVHAEVGTILKGSPIFSKEELATKEAISAASTIVIDFPVKSPAKVTRENQTLEEQLDTYFQFQEYYTQHNSSNTITVKDGEWGKVQEIILDGWDSFVGVSFLPYSGGTFTLMPYEEITEEEYDEMIKDFDEFNIKDLYKVEKQVTLSELDEDCNDGG